MKRLTACLLIFAAFSSAPAFADSFDQKALIVKAVDSTIKNYKEGGIAKLTEVSSNCYRGLDLSIRNKNRERDAQYCIAQDNASIKLYALLSASERQAAGDHFASIDNFFMAWISTADAVVRITPEQYKYYLGPLMTGAYDTMSAKFNQ